MGKRQHQKDKMYITYTEWTTQYGGKKAGSDIGEKAAFRRLPFDHCSLSLQPFEHPYCTPDGTIYDLTNIMPYIKKFGTNPITGEPMEAKTLIRLYFHKNAEGKYHCPTTYKVFTKNSHIVAIKPTGNVYAYDAVETLNIKTKNLRDLLTDEAFTRKDIITLQDPNNLDKFNIATFHHVKNSLKANDEEEKKAREDPSYYLKATTSVTTDILNELYREYKPKDDKKEEVKKADNINAAHYSTGAVAAGFTSTTMTPQTEHEAALIDEDIVRYQRIKKKGYVRIITNKGQLNLELHCDMVPKTCENFMLLSSRGYYNDTVFHRSIRNFMIQGGDPTGTGKGGESAWGKPFKDEFKPNLTHSGRGILSMANSGTNTNKSQFFLTFRSCRHLDNKHTVFGRIVGGLETLSAMEAIETDRKDRPKEEIKIDTISVFVNPFDEVNAELKKEREKDKRTQEAARNKPSSTVSVAPKSDVPPTVYRAGVGKYISAATASASKKSTEEESTKSQSKKKSKGGFGDFSSW
ncbi:RING-type E3 ubiquitin-protein ligase PPIL2-like [Saccoglossus kowalevskii]|uniref:RING-type E3 ubiquitin transferase n=1 Tax=Saccoglossus kowalevskii TaxID=10224 RepID=A0ABM0GVW7_SACKO|nr:PREDICTED: peptidyl-prolyl cis-trans isomerase-like 2-like [Saccoglossus kowalevskii]